MFLAFFSVRSHFQEHQFFEGSGEQKTLPSLVSSTQQDLPSQSNLSICHHTPKTQIRQEVRRIRHLSQPRSLSSSSKLNTNPLFMKNKNTLFATPPSSRLFSSAHRPYMNRSYHVTYFHRVKIRRDLHVTLRSCCSCFFLSVAQRGGVD